MKPPHTLNTEGFCAALVSALITKGITSIKPRSESARHGFQAVLRSLDKAVQIAGKKGDRDWLYELLKIRTSLAPSTNGSFDSFEACLRGLQTSMVSSPNPAFADLRFNVSRSYAKSSLDRLDARWAELAKSAAEEFRQLGNAGPTTDERQHDISAA